MGRLVVPVWVCARDVAERLSSAVLTMISFRGRFDRVRNRRGHEEVMPKQRDDDEQACEPDWWLCDPELQRPFRSSFIRVSASLHVTCRNGPWLLAPRGTG